MAQTEKPQATQPQKPAEAHPLEEGPESVAGGLRQIQKIIVEPLFRQLEASIEALDARRQKDLADLRKELDRSIDRSDDFIKKESSVLSDSLVAERRERARQLDERAHELDARLKAIEERVRKLEDQLVSDTRELRQASLDQYRQYTEELRGWRDDMARAIAREITGLRAEKADRSVLAHLLSEVGERLSGTAQEPTRH